MATVAMYPHPGTQSSNYYSQKQRGYRICDQCGAVENPAVARFRLCGGCMTTQYCSPDCQKSHWTSHKAICQHTAHQQHAPQLPSSSESSELLVKSLRKFTSAHTTLLGWAGFQALKLKRTPSNIRQSALLIEVAFNPRVADAHRRFAVSTTHIVPLNYIRDPLVVEDIQRREQRSRAAGGIGALVIIIQCGGISQVVPVEVDPPSKISWETREDWEHILRAFVDSGRMDFKPSSGGR
ncbi:hypothetical protein ONZ45_g5542 [Pleurotus djamor]|nr:hypothetical protein ONZ45_g5542 [Pleurotus djamor]